MYKHVVYPKSGGFIRVGCYNVVMFLERLSQAVIEKCAIHLEKPTLLGVSGGMDSLALMYGLKALGYNLVVAHVDHGLRPESQKEARYVRQLAESQQLPFISQRIDVEQIAETQGQSIEETAREVRYQFLFKQARAQQCQAVAVAHHADDQVETILMHFMRGAALPGLTGMPYRRILTQWDIRIPLIRPLLNFWRKEIEEYIAEVGVIPCFDMSNLDTTYYRNRIRHELIPVLETYNPSIKTVIWRMAEVLQEEESFLDDLTQEAYGQCLVSASEDRILLNLTTFIDLSTALKRRVLRQAIAQLRPDLRDIGFDPITRGLSFLTDADPQGEIDLVARLNLAVIDDIIVIKTWDSELPDFGQPLLPNAQFTAFLEPETSVTLRNGWVLQASLLEDYDDRMLNEVKQLTPGEAWLDYDLLDLPLVVRGRHEGERFTPLGMNGHTKGLQDYFVNRKVPEHLRAMWPLVISGEKIAWVVGLRPSEDFKITDATQRVLKLKLVKTND